MTMTQAALDAMQIGHIAILVEPDPQSLEDAINTAVAKGTYELVGPASVSTHPYPQWTATIRRVLSPLEIVGAFTTMK